MEPPTSITQFAQQYRTVRTANMGTQEAAILQSDERLEYPHERYASTPFRPRGATTASRPESFIALVLRLAPTTIEAAPAPLYITAEGEVDAILNDDRDNGSPYGAWRDWRLCYRPTPTESWRRWNEVNGKPQNQLDAAEFIQERLADFFKPLGADMLELAQKFEVARAGKYVSAQRLADGNMEFVVQEENKPKTQIKVPEKVTLVMRVFEGLAPYKFDAYFRWRVHNDVLFFTFKLVNREDVLRMAVDGIVEALNKGLPKHTLYHVTKLPDTVAAIAPPPIPVADGRAGLTQR